MTVGAAAGEDNESGKVARRKPKRVDRPPSPSKRHNGVLRALAAQEPGISLETITHQLIKRCGVKVSTLTVRRTLATAGIVRIGPARRAVAAERAAGPQRYGDSEAHRREAIGRDSACCLTDAEWALVADLFERSAGIRGSPAQVDRRVLVEACCYVLRTGCAWRLLPKEFSAWTTVHKSFARWAAAGRFGRHIGLMGLAGRSAYPHRPTG